MSKKFMSLLLVLIMVFNLVPNLKTPYLYAEENIEWIKNIEVAKTTMDSKKISFAIDYLGEQNSEYIRRYISYFKFFLNGEEVNLTPESKLILEEKINNDMFKQEGRIELEVNLPDNMNLENLSSLNLDVVPFVRQETNEDIEIIKNFKENNLKIILSDEEYLKYEMSYNSLSDEKKLEFSKYITDNQTQEIITIEKLKETIQAYLTKKLVISLNEKEDIKNSILVLEDKINLQKSQGKILVEKSFVNNLKLSIDMTVSDIKSANVLEIDNLFQEYSNAEINLQNNAPQGQVVPETQILEENLENQAVNEQLDNPEEVNETPTVTKTQEETVVEEVKNIEENTVTTEEITQTEATEEIKIEETTESNEENAVENNIQEVAEKSKINLLKIGTTVVFAEDKVPLSLPLSSNLENTLLVYEIKGANSKNIAITLENENIESPKVSIVRTNEAEPKIYPRETMIFTVSIDNAQLSSTIENSYISIKVPTKYLLRNSYTNNIAPESIVVPKTNAMKENPIITHNVDGSEFSEIKIFLGKLDKTTSVSFPINIKVNPRLTPDGYAVTPTLDMYLKNSNNQDIKLLSGVQGKDNDASLGTISVKYELPQLYKSVATKMNVDDKSFVYGGSLDENSLIMQNGAEDVEFLYSLTTTNPNVSFTYYKDNNLPLPKGVQVNQTYGIGLLQVRLYEELIVTETLPKYIKTDGSTAIAKFDESKNPGWEAIIENGVVTKVRYVVKETSDKTAERLLEDDLKLTLSFPDFKALRESNFEDINALLKEAEKYKYESSTDIELVAKGESEYEKANRKTISDKLKYTLTGHGFFGAGMFAKRSVGSSVDVDNGAMHLITSDYNVSLINKQSYPINKLVIKDIYDSRYFVKHIKWNQTTNSKDVAMNKRLMEGFDGIYGIKEDGTQVRLDTTIDDMKFYGKNNVATVDKATQAKVMEKVAEFKAAQANGTHVDISTLQVEGEYKSIEFRMKPDFKFQPGDYIDLIFQMGFTHPYGLSQDIDNTSYKYLKNQATVDGEMVVSSNTKISINDKLKSEANVLLKLKSFRSNMTSETVENKSGSIGEKIYFSVRLDLENMSKLQIYENPYLIVMLPEGISPQDDGNRNIGETFISTLSPGRALLEEFLEDGQMYKYGSGVNERWYFDKNKVKQVNIGGKRVLIFDLKGFALENISKNQTIDFNIFGKINEKSIPKELMSQIEDSNTVYTFFYADNLTKNINGTDSPNAKEDKFGIIDMLKEQGLVGSDITENQLLTTSARYNATLPTEIRSEKWIGSQKAYNGETNWKKEDDILDTEYNEKFYYKIVTKNYSQERLSKLMIYDILPYQNDGNDTTFAKNSGFSNVLNDAVEVVGDKSKFDIYYYVGSSIPNKDPKTYLDSNNNWVETNADWTKEPSNYNDVKAIFIIMKSGNVIAPITNQEFILHMKTPSTSSNSSGKMANNEFLVFNNKNNNFGQSNYVINRLSDSKIKIQYKDLLTGEIISEEVILKGGVGQSFDITDNNKDISGYKKVGLINQNPKGEFKSTEQTFIYYYKKESKINVKYVEVDEAGNVISNPTLSAKDYSISGLVGDNYSTDKKVFDGYEYVGVDGVQVGKFESDEKTVIYKYKKIVAPSVPSNPAQPTGPSTDTPVVPDNSNPQGGGNTPSTTPNEPSVPSNPAQPVQPSTDTPAVPDNSNPQGGGNTPSTTPDEPSNPNTQDREGTPIREVPEENPPTNVPFVPDRIVNIDKIPENIERPVLDIVNEDNVPLGKAEIDKENGTYTFIEDDVTPLGKAKIYADNTLEILEDDIPLSLPKTGQNGNILMYLFGGISIICAFALRRKYRF